MTKDGETVLRTRGMRRAVTALAVAAAAAMAVPAQANAQPTPPPVPEGIPVEMLASFAPAIIGAAAGTEDIAAGPQDAILDQARILLESPGIPPELKSTLERVITFLDAAAAADPRSRRRTHPSSRSSSTRPSARVASERAPTPVAPHSRSPVRPSCPRPDPRQVRPVSCSPPSEPVPLPPNSPIR